MVLRETSELSKELSNSEDEDDSSEESDEEESAEEPPAVKMLLVAFMVMFMGYGAMVGNPSFVLRGQLGLVTHEQHEEYQDATATFQLGKLVMRIFQIAFLVFIPPNGIVYLAYGVMFVAMLCPVVLVYIAGIHQMWVVYVQYILGGVAIGLFEGTFLSCISSLGKNTKTFAIMGAPLGFAVHNIVLPTFAMIGMPSICYFLVTAFCLPFGAAIFYVYAPAADPKAAGKGCQVFMKSMSRAGQWMPKMIVWFIAKFVGNFVLENGFPLLFNTFNTEKVPLFGLPSSTVGLFSFNLYKAWIWFPCMAAGDTVSRRVPNWIPINSFGQIMMYLTIAVVMCTGGEAAYFLLIPLVTAFAAFVSNFGNGFIYGLSAKYIDTHIAEEHRYAAYNLWCFFGDLGGYAGQSSLSVVLADCVCKGRHFEYVCHSRAGHTGKADTCKLW